MFRLSILLSFVSIHTLPTSMSIYAKKKRLLLVSIPSATRRQLSVQRERVLVDPAKDLADGQGFGADAGQGDDDGQHVDDEEHGGGKHEARAEDAEQREVAP